MTTTTTRPASQTDQLAARLWQIVGQLSRLRGNTTAKALQIKEDLKAEQAEIRANLAKRSR